MRAPTPTTRDRAVPALSPMPPRPTKDAGPALARSPLPAQDHLPDLRGTRTHENLGAALALDTQAAILYASFARIAEIEGYPEVARTLRELAEAQGVIAGGHLDLLRRVGDPLSGRPIGETIENLRALADDASGPLLEPYAAAARTAHAEGFADVASWFETLVHARRDQHARLVGALDQATGRTS